MGRARRGRVETESNLYSLPKASSHIFGLPASKRQHFIAWFCAGERLNGPLACHLGVFPTQPAKSCADGDGICGFFIGDQ